MVEGEIRIDMTVEIYQQCQEIVESEANIICQLKLGDDRLAVAIIIFHISKGHYDEYIPSVE